MKSSEFVKPLSALILIFVNTITIYSQSRPPIKVSGIVLSEERTPLAFTNIVVEGTNLGTISEVEG